MTGDIEIMEEMIEDIENMTYGSVGGMRRMIEAYMDKYGLTEKECRFIAIKALEYSK